MTIAELSGAKDCSNTSNVFYQQRITVLINLFILGRSGGMLPQDIFLTSETVSQFYQLFLYLFLFFLLHLSMPSYMICSQLLSSIIKWKVGGTKICVCTQNS